MILCYNTKSKLPFSPNLFNVIPRGGVNPESPRFQISPSKPVNALLWRTVNLLLVIIFSPSLETGGGCRDNEKILADGRRPQNTTQQNKTQIWKNFPILLQLYFSFVFHHYHEPVPVGWLWWIDIVSWIYFVVVFLLRPFPSKMNVSGADAIWLLSTEGLQSSYQQIIFKILFLIITGTCINITTGSVGEYVGKDETKMARRCDPIAGRADAFLTCVWVSEIHNA